ncbi:hypothetical protein D9M68_901370 [compost metagenome]
MLRGQGEAGLAAQVGRFTAHMPEVRTDDQRLAVRWREAEKSRMLERADTKLREPKVR